MADPENIITVKPVLSAEARARIAARWQTLMADIEEWRIGVDHG